MTETHTTGYTAIDLAGYCNELVLWRLLRDITATMERPVALTPDLVLVNSVGDFELSHQAGECSEPEAVWAIGELLSYLSSGRSPFGGRGADYRRAHPAMPLPSLRREHASLTPLVHACLAVDPAKRPSIAHLAAQAAAGLLEATDRLHQRLAADASASNAADCGDLDTLWPDAY